LLSLQARSQDWRGARKTLNAKLKHGSLPRDVHKRRDAVLALSQARGILDDGQTIEAREAAIESNRLSPDLVPAAVMVARSYIEQDKHKYALRVIKKAWGSQPHPDLAAVFCEITPDETPLERLKRFEALSKLAPEHRETKLALAELHLVAEDFPGARRALGTLLDQEPDAHILTIMAAIERGEGGEDHAVRAWLAKALSAQRGPQWVCENCQTAQSEWDPVCPSCEAFDTMSWKEPPATTFSSSTHLEMLPLLVGKRANGEVSRPVDYIERDAKEEIDEKDPSPADHKI
ncbi:MAG: tetratricopeptide repeat protein, partial [Paracoccaceae bacterium]|nr:tetratricopeptide repeat protein [Paracoccaceae bacterium]